MASIGRDVVTAKQPIQTNTLKRNMDYRAKILELLRTSQRPLNIAEISRATNISYMSVRHILSELLLAGQVSRYESAKCLFYQIAK